MIAISILGIKDDNDKIIEVDKLKTDYIHLDIADGLFVPNYVNLTDIPSLKTKLDSAKEKCAKYKINYF